MLVFLTPGFPENEGDTTCLPPVQQFFLALKKYKDPAEITIVTFQYPFVASEYRWNGIKVIALGGKNRKGFYRLLTWYKAYKVLGDLLHKNEIQGLLSFWLTECALIAKWFGRKHAIKALFWLHGQDARQGNKYVKLVRPRAEQMIAISDFIKEEFMRNHGIQPSLTAENGINTECFPAFTGHPRSIEVMAAGSLIKLKNYPLLIAIVADIKKQLPDIKVVIAGEGTEEHALKAAVAAAGLSGTIRFTGKLPHAQVLRLMSESKVFLHTSLYEGNSTVMIEALYSGCMTVSTQPLSSRATENLAVSQDKDELVSAVIKGLKDTDPPKRVLFNSMEITAGKILGWLTGELPDR